MKNVLKQVGKAVCYLICFVGMQLLIGLIAGTVYGIMEGVKLAQGAALSEEAVKNQISNATNQFLLDQAIPLAVIADVLAVLFLWVFFSIRKKKFAQEISFRKIEGKDYLMYALLGVAMSFVVLGVLSMLPEKMMADYGEASSILVTTPSVFSILAEAVLIPICEEIFFRGLIFSRLKKAMSPVIAAIVASVLFGSVHGTNLVWVGYAFALGCIFAFLVHKTGSVQSSMLSHMFFNLFGGTLLPALSEKIPDAVFYVLAGISLIAAALILRMTAKRRVDDGLFTDTDKRENLDL